MDAWIPYIYQYGVGGFFFLLAIYLAYDRGLLNMQKRSDRRLVINMLLGLVFYLCLHGFWILAVQMTR